MCTRVCVHTHVLKGNSSAVKLTRIKLFNKIPSNYIFMVIRKLMPGQTNGLWFYGIEVDFQIDWKTKTHSQKPMISDWHIKHNFWAFAEMNTPTKGTVLISNKLDINRSTVAFKQWKRTRTFFGEGGAGQGGGQSQIKCSKSLWATYTHIQKSKNLLEISILSVLKGNTYWQMSEGRVGVEGQEEISQRT